MSVRALICLLSLFIKDTMTNDLIKHEQATLDSKLLQGQCTQN